MQNSVKELHEAVTEIYDVAAIWNTVTAYIDKAKLKDSDLGLIGKAAGCVDSYNSKVVDAMIQKFKDGSKSLVISGETLNRVIKNYDKTEVVNRQAILDAREGFGNV